MDILNKFPAFRAATSVETVGKGSSLAGALLGTHDGPWSIRSNETDSLEGIVPGGSGSPYGGAVSAEKMFKGCVTSANGLIFTHMLCYRCWGARWRGTPAGSRIARSGEVLGH